MFTEVDYRKDEGAPYDNSKYGDGMPAAQTNETREDKEVGIIRKPVEEAAPAQEPAAPAPEIAAPPIAKAAKKAAKKATKKVSKPVTPPSTAPAAPVPTDDNETPEAGEEEQMAVNKVRKPKAAKSTKAAKVRVGKKSAPVMRTGTSAGDRASAGAGGAKRAIPSAVKEVVEEGFKFTLAQVSKKTGVPELRINAYRRQGLLPKRGGFKKAGRAVMYSQKAVDSIAKLVAGGGRKARATSKPQVNKVSKVRKAGSAAAGVGVGVGDDDKFTAALRQRIEFLRSQAAAFIEKADRLESALALL
jgi:hypothetical protein